MTLVVRNPERVRLPDPQFVDVKGVRTCFHDRGSGSDTIVLMYGGNFGMTDPAISACEWGYNFSALARCNRVIAFDKLGQGYTGAPLRDEDYVMGAVTQHAIAFLEAMGLPPVHLVGHSRGGMPAVRVAMERPDLIRSLTVVASSTLSPGVGLNEVTIGRPPFPPETVEAARWVSERCCYAPETVTDDWLIASRDVLALESYQTGIRKMRDEKLAVSQFIPNLASYKRETFRMIEEGLLQRPTQVIWGSNDPTAPLERGLRLYEMIAAQQRMASFTAVNQSGHFPFAEHPEQFNAKLQSFIALQQA